MANEYEQTTYLERELMFKNKAEPYVKCQLGNCKLGLVKPNHVRLDVTEGSNVYYNYVTSVTFGQYDNMLCVESQNGVTFFLFECREDRDEWYSTIKQLQHGQVPSFPKKRESLPARTDRKPAERFKTSASSPSTLQEMFKKQLETEINRNLKKPVLKKGSGSYVNMDYNKALQDSKESYKTLNLLHGMQNAPVEDDMYDVVPDEDSPSDLIEEDLYEPLEDDTNVTEDQIYDDLYDENFTEDKLHEGGVGPPGPWGRNSDQTSPPPLPPRPATMQPLQSSDGEEDDVYEPVTEPDIPPPIPARPPSITTDLDQMKRGGNMKNKSPSQSKIQPKLPSTGLPQRTQSRHSEGERGGAKTLSIGDQSLADELAMKLRDRAKTLDVSHKQNQNRSKSSTSSKTDLSSQLEKVQLRSQDRQSNSERQGSSGISEELREMLAKRSSAISCESTGLDLPGQTSCDRMSSTHITRRGSMPSVEQQSEPSSPSWKQPQGQLSQTTPRKKPFNPPPTPSKPGKSQPNSLLNDQMNMNKKPKNPPPTPAKKPVKPPTADEIYEDTEVAPPVVNPKPKPSKVSPVRNELEVRIPRHAFQNQLAGSVIFKNQSNHVVIERTSLPDYLHVGDQVLKIGDIDVCDSCAMFVTECWKRVSENQVRVKILR